MPKITMRAVPPLVADLQREQADWLVHAAAQPTANSLRVALLNLMPTKAVTERQWLRLMAQAPLTRPIHIDLLRLDNWTPRHVSEQHMAQYYRPLSEVSEVAERLSDYDAFVITGAPLGHMHYAEVRYWSQIERLFWRLQNAAVPTLYSCWAAQAALYQRYGIATLRRPEKLSGVFKQAFAPLISTPKTASQAPLNAEPDRHAQLAHYLQQGVRQLSSPVVMPQSRFALPDPHTLDAHLKKAGQPLRPVLVNHQDEHTVLVDEAQGHLLLLGHPEYELDTLLLEYQRDHAKQPDCPAPRNYNPNDRTTSTAWQALGANLLGTWLTQVAAR